jgi:hypothetical protein
VHSSTALAPDAFAIEVDDRPAGLDDVWPAFEEGDRVGVVLRDPIGALGASALIALSVTAFYETLRARHGDDFFRYADFYLFGAGCDIADYGELDVWPDHKHVACAPDAESILQAVNDRAITRLVVPDATPLGGAIERQTRTSAEARLRSAIAYSPTGRVEGADLSILADRVVESYVEVVLFGNPQWIDEAREAELKAWRASLFEGRKSARETYRRLTVAEALDAL